MKTKCEGHVPTNITTEMIIQFAMCAVCGELLVYSYKDDDWVSFKIVETGKKCLKGESE